jgi:hypothetical protein
MNQPEPNKEPRNTEHPEHRHDKHGHSHGCCRCWICTKCSEACEHGRMMVG